MTLLRGLITAWLLAIASLAVAQTVAPAPVDQAQVDRIWTVLDLDGSLDILRQEGQSMAADVARDYLPGRRGAGWDRAMQDIYDADRMGATMRRAFASDLTGADTGAVLAFFDTDLGHRIIGLEMSARRAFLDPDTEAAAYDLIASGTVSETRADLIEIFMDVNDLVAFNMSGALNTNVSFLTGLATSDLFRMSESDIIDQVYNNAEETRSETEDWLRAYLTLAYQPLSDDELKAYIRFSETQSGQRLNRALFAGFGAMYDAQYRALGQAVSDQLSAQDL